jgi:hypothetical protein
MATPKTDNLGLYLSIPANNPDPLNHWAGHIDENFISLDASIKALQDGGGGSATSFADDETPAGAINGSNTAFTLAHTPNPASSLQLFKNGQLQKPGGADYTLTGAAIAFVIAPQTGDALEAFYRY